MAQIKLFTCVALAALLVGCSGSPSIDDPQPTDTVYGDTATTDGTGNDLMRGGEDVTSKNEDLQTVIYFAFDSSEVRPQEKDMIARKEMQISNESRERVRMEGQAEERG